MSGLNIGMVAGEPSGDLLASRIQRGLQLQDPNAVFNGIGGPEMTSAGFNAWYPMDALSVFGYVDALKSLPRLLNTYYGVRRRWLKQHPDVFVGIDAPDFNLRMEADLRKSGIATVQFVSPSIWAWRYERIHTIRKAVSHMLVLFPFEVEIYQKEGIPVTYVGHPLAQNIPLVPDQKAARQRLNIPEDVKILGVLPGSRKSEIMQLAPRFLKTVQRLQKDDPTLHVVVPVVNEARHQQFLEILRDNPVENLRIITNDTQAPVFLEDGGKKPVAWDVMEASDALLVASGTATLEAALYKKPMVISYVLTPMMKKLMAWQSGQEKPLLDWIGLPNILSQDFVVPELLQDDAEPEKLAKACEQALHDSSWREGVVQRFQQLHEVLRVDTPKLAAEVIMQVARER